MPAGLKPIVDKNATTLILGSFPGPLSLERNQYYAHPRNLFWPILARIGNFDINAKYDSRTKKLEENRIAVRDVLESCEREGAEDRRIRNPVANDFERFFRQCPQIKTVVLNGRKAEKLFRRLILRNQQLPDFVCAYAPSTSPANTRSPFETKLLAWETALK